VGTRDTDWGEKRKTWRGGGDRADPWLRLVSIYEAFSLRSTDSLI